MEQQLEAIRHQGLTAILQSGSLEELNELRVGFLGKKGRLTAVLRGLGELPVEERPRLGSMANEIKRELAEALSGRETELKARNQEERLLAEGLDVTLPGKRLPWGSEHILSQVRREIEEVFLGLGYTIAEGPEVELDYYNFEALNMPREHPARDMQDSFYLSNEVLLRTHTSPVQVRVMEAKRPGIPIKVIAPGRVYRRDDDATHSPMFHQVEGLLVDYSVTFADLKGTLLAFTSQLFGQERRVRFRPSYFPFTEPSAEMDISCLACRGQGCRVCSNSGWLEILGCGLVHPRVLAMSGYDPEAVSGFAFGMGVERIAMLKYGIDDLRLFFENDLRFLRQF